MPRKCLQLHKKVGAGHFGEVYAGTHPSLALFISLCVQCDADYIVVDTNENLRRNFPREGRSELKNMEKGVG